MASVPSPWYGLSLRLDYSVSFNALGDPPLELARQHPVPRRPTDSSIELGPGGVSVQAKCWVQMRVASLRG